jgi:hypothetical protein
VPKGAKLLTPVVVGDTVNGASVQVLVITFWSAGLGFTIIVNVNTLPTQLFKKVAT